MKNKHVREFVTLALGLLLLELGIALILAIVSPNSTHGSKNAANVAEDNVVFQFSDGLEITMKKSDFQDQNEALDANKVKDTVTKVIRDAIEEGNIFWPSFEKLLLTPSGIQVVGARDGNFVNPNTASEFALEKLQAGEQVIDFSSIAMTDITVPFQEEVENIMKANIRYELRDGSAVTLDSQTKQKWLREMLKVADDGEVSNLNVNVEEECAKSCTEFLNNLQEKVQKLSTTIDFKTQDGSSVSLQCEKTDAVDLETEKRELVKALMSGNEIDRAPKYANYVNFNSYVEIDISRQTVYMVTNGVKNVESPCVTGNRGNHDTPVGIWFLDSKETERFLQGTNDNGSRYKSWVNYWMPFLGGYGMHDATWRSKFGGSIYDGNGSHGCVNLPLDAARAIYEQVDYNMPIVIH